VYVVNANQTVSAFSVGTGALTAIAGNPVNPGSAGSVAVSRANTYLYVGGAGAIYCYSIGTTGAITEVTASGIGSLGTYGIISMDTSPNGEYLVAVGTSSGANPQIYVFSTNTSSGALAEVSVTPMVPPASGAVNAASVRVSANGAYVGVALGGGGDLVYPFNESTGGLSTPTKLVPLPSGYEDNYLVFDPTSSYVYLGRYGLSSGTGSVVTLSLSSTGALTQTSTVAAGNAVKWILVNSSGADVYTANSADQTISGFSAASGVLTAVTESPFSAAAGVTSLVEDNSGKYVIAAADGGTGTTDLTLYEFDALTPTKLDAVATYANGSGVTGSVAIAATH